jgi:hypothetical protein
MISSQIPHLRRCCDFLVTAAYNFSTLHSSKIARLAFTVFVTKSLTREGIG